MAPVSAGERSPCGTLWIRLRGNDSVSCGEGVFVAHEPSCFSVTGYSAKYRAKLNG